MYWDVEGLECKVYHGLVKGIPVCDDHLYYDFSTADSCKSKVDIVQKAYDHLTVCLESKGVKMDLPQ